MDFIRVDIMALTPNGVVGGVGYFPVDEMANVFGISKTTDLICGAMFEWFREVSVSFKVPCVPQWSYRGVSLSGEKAQKKLELYKVVGPGRSGVFINLPVQIVPWGDFSNG